MGQAVGVERGSHPLGDDVDEVVLEVLGHPGDEGHAHGAQQQHGDPADELARGVLAEAGGVVVDDVAEDQGIAEGEHLVGGGEEEGEDD